MKEENLNYDIDNNIYNFITACKEDLNIEIEIVRKVKINYMSVNGFTDVKITVVIKLSPSNQENELCVKNSVNQKLYEYAYMYKIGNIIII